MHGDSSLFEPFSGFHLFLAILFIFLNAFFVAAEFAMVKVRETRLETLKEEGNWLAGNSLFITHHLNAYLSVTQLGITLASLGLGWLGEPVFARMIAPVLHWFSLSEPVIRGVSFGLAFTLITMLHLVLGELLPKQMAIQAAEKTLLAVTIPMRFFYVIFFPFLWILNHLTGLLVRWLGFQNLQDSDAHTEEELRLIVEDSYEEGSLSPRKASLIENVFEFSQRKVRHIMVPRRDIVHLPLKNSIEENLAIAKESGHTRFPLCDGDLDRVLGVIIIKDVIWALQDPDRLINLYDLKRPAIFVPEGKPIDQLLIEFQAKKIHMAIVVDEYGSTTGLVTMEDVMEELVGEIQDEFDVEQPRISKPSEDEFLVDGGATIREVEQGLDLLLHDAVDVSIGGYFVNRLGHMPREGDFLFLSPYKVIAKEVKNHRVLKLLFEKQPELVSEQTEEAAT